MENKSQLLEFFSNLILSASDDAMAISPLISILHPRILSFSNFVPKAGYTPLARIISFAMITVSPSLISDILFTSMNHDGVKTGYANEALAQLSTLPIPIIASGGAGNMQHFYDAFSIGKADAALAASVFHFGEISILELKRFLNEKGVKTRI